MNCTFEHLLRQGVHSNNIQDLFRKMTHEVVSHKLQEEEMEPVEDILKAIDNYTSAKNLIKPAKRPEI